MGTTGDRVSEQKSNPDSRQRLKYLSKKDALSILEVIDTSAACKEEDDFRCLLGWFGRRLGAEGALCILARTDRHGKIDSAEAINAGFPEDWLDQYMSKRLYHIDPVAIENFRHYGVQYWDNTYNRCAPPPELRLHLTRFSLGRGYSCGARDVGGQKGGSLFSFSGGSIKQDPRTEIILDYAVSFLHEAAMRIRRADPGPLQDLLTERELEVLECIGGGMSDKDISSRLEISEHTVKFHVKNILLKLNATSRYHAIALALQKGLIRM